MQPCLTSAVLITENRRPVLLSHFTALLPS